MLMQTNLYKDPVLNKHILTIELLFEIERNYQYYLFKVVLPIILIDGLLGLYYGCS